MPKPPVLPTGVLDLNKLNTLVLSGFLGDNSEHCSHSREEVGSRGAISIYLIEIIDKKMRPKNILRVYWTEIHPFSCPTIFILLVG